MEWLGVKAKMRLKHVRIRTLARWQKATRSRPRMSPWRALIEKLRQLPARTRQRFALLSVGALLTSTAISTTILFFGMSSGAEYVSAAEGGSDSRTGTIADLRVGNATLVEVEAGTGAFAATGSAPPPANRAATYAYLAAHDALRLRLVVLANPELSAAAEERLELSRAQRREIQRRLKFVKHDPKGIDGIFGPATRDAIKAWQEASGIPPTGYLNAHGIEMLTAETQPQYRSWEIAVRKEREHAARMAAVAPAPRPEAEVSECDRLVSGEIEYGKNFRCDLRGLRESFGSVGSKISGLFGGGARAERRRYGASIPRHYPDGA